VVVVEAAEPIVLEHQGVMAATEVVEKGPTKMMEIHLLLEQQILAVAGVGRNQI
jgi:hypothetical protein